MALREKLVERSQPHLEPGEQVRHVFWCQTGPSPYFFILTYLIIFWIKYRIVVVTDRAVVVLESKKLSAKPTGKVVARLPRNTRLGPVSGIWSAVEVTGEKLWVNKRFHKDIAAADAEIDGGPSVA